MSAVTSAPDSVTTVNVRSSPGGVGGPSRSGLASSSSTPMLGELAAQLGLQVRPEPRAEDVVGHVEEGHVLVRPDRLDLAGQLDADRPGAEQQHPLRRG